MYMSESHRYGSLDGRGGLGPRGRSAFESQHLTRVPSNRPIHQPMPLLGPLASLHRLATNDPHDHESKDHRGRCKCNNGGGHLRTALGSVSTHS
jgi:hypothetical protein